MTTFLAPDELERIGFAAYGREVRISRLASFHGAQRIVLGDHVRIDDFCLLSAGTGGIEIGRHVHVAAYTSLIGRGRMRLGDFANLSSRVSIYSSSDDYSGYAMTNPTVPEALTAVKHADVEIGRHVIVGCGSVVLPGAVLEEGAAVAALSLVRGRCEAFGIYGGAPARRLKARSRRLLELERQLTDIDRP
ncbi:acyltransferase [Cognatilysobacter terrigena]|uniref:acyltransferase n=1 Tax=Cognatilysobacter terrigena TaxID=2488749 RepID=UPI00105D9290|nr:acyltransferase [Lysobacter terrigena]